MKQTIKRGSSLLLVLLLSLLLGSISASAAHINEWVTTSKGVVNYYNEKGKKVTGKQKINGKIYLFDSKGRQLVGWQKIGSEYYFFNIQKKAKASMVTGTTVNGIKINKKGVASRSSSTNSRKLKVMAAANRTLQSLTNYSLTMKKRDKLRKCFNYTMNKFRCCNIGSFRRSDSHWDLYYAERVLIPTDSQYRADCYTYGCAMAYLANACGSKGVCVSSGGHGWCTVDGYVCDPNWDRVDKCHSLFMRSINATSGCSNTPRYKGAGIYTIKV